MVGGSGSALRGGEGALMRAAKPAVELVESGRSRGRMFGMVGDEGPDGLGEERVEDEDARQLT